MKEIKDSIQIIVIMTVINLVVLLNFISRGEAKHGIGYFLFFYVAILTIYFFTKRISPKREIEVKEPKKELILATIFALIGVLFLTLNFMLKANFLPNSLLVKIIVMLGAILFAMPLGILIYLLLKKYKLLQLGIYLKPLSYLLLGGIIYGLTGLFAFVFNESGIIWKEGLKELGGVLGVIFEGIIAAALVEEFSRFIIQSRFEKVYKTLGVNILFATAIWSFMHFPVTYFKNENVFNTLTYCIQIIPIGFIWGYLTQRTKSILPSVFVHGLNLWGFQNG